MVVKPCPARIGASAAGKAIGDAAHLTTVRLAQVLSRSYGGHVVAPTLINTMRGSDGAIVVEIRGEVDVASTERLRRVLRDAARTRPTALIVDMLYVTFI